MSCYPFLKGRGSMKRIKCKYTNGIQYQAAHKEKIRLLKKPSFLRGTEKTRQVAFSNATCRQTLQRQDFGDINDS